MADEPKWYYERLKEDGTKETVYENKNDFDGKITGKIVFGVKAWFDENPEERKRRGWVKHIVHSTKDVEYNRQTQYLVPSVKTIDEFTVEDEYHILDKSEEQMRLNELNGGWFASDDDVVFTFGGSDNG